MDRPNSPQKHKSLLLGLISLLLCCGIPLPLDAGRDPTEPNNAERTEKISVFNVNSIITSDENAQAQIDGHVVKPGDKIGHAQVLQIQRNAVTLLVEGRIVTLPLFDEWLTASNDKK